MKKKTAYTGMLVALAFIFSYIEALIPISIGIPGVKLGLANLVVIVALYTLGVRQAAALSIVRILLAGFTFGNVASMMYSLAGGVLSLAVMIIMKKLKLFSITGVSVLGAVSHNIGQIAVAVVVLETKSLFYYLPVLFISGTAAGVIIGIIGAELVRRLERFIKSQK